MERLLVLLLVERLAKHLQGAEHVAVGASSPIPATAALLARHREPSLRVSLLGAESTSDFTDGGRELFDCAAQGRIDYFFFSGVQLDGAANINLVGRGHYPSLDQRFAGSFGSAYLYHHVPKVILFCWNHSLATLVNRVDFISAAGPRNDGVWRRGGPVILLTDRCEFSYQRFNKNSENSVQNPQSNGEEAAGGFVLTSLHPDQSLQSIADNTGFTYPVDDGCTNAVRSSATELEQVEQLIIDNILPELAESYPRFVSRWQQEQA